MSKGRGPAATEALYGWLSRWTLLANRRRFADPDARLTMHKALRTGAGGAGGPLLTVDRVLDAAAPPSGGRLLDLGSGFGGAVFRMQRRRPDLSFEGWTISAFQQRVAAREAARRGLGDRCRFLRRDFDDDHPSRFDGAVAVEALVHSRDQGALLARVARMLGPGGRIVLVEDMAGDGLGPEDPDLARLRARWRLAALPSRADWQRMLVANGFEIQDEEDLTALVPARSEADLAAAERRHLHLRRLAPGAGAAAFLDAWLGGIALERLYRRGRMRYGLIAAARRRR